ncbi:MAG: dihydrofolate reductase [Pseudobdellovibrionaceae bacterium]
MILSHIVACAENGGIGLNNTLPWSLPEDMAFFRNKTKGHILIMGRKTFDSFGGRTLPQRIHIVVSRSKSATDHKDVFFVQNLDEAIHKAQTLIPQWPNEVFIIGGGQIYKESMPHTRQIYITQIHQSFSADTFYPKIDKNLFECVEKLDRFEPISFSFEKYIRKGL